MKHAVLCTFGAHNSDPSQQQSHRGDEELICYRHISPTTPRFVFNFRFQILHPSKKEKFTEKFKEQARNFSADVIEQEIKKRGVGVDR